MNLAPIIVPVEEAKSRLAAYESVLRAQRSSEDEAIAAGYRAAARGLPIIRLSQVVAAGGWFSGDRPDSGLPRIAVARADAQRCWVQVERGWQEPSELVFADAADALNRGSLVGRRTVRVRLEERAPDRPTGRWGRASTVVPIIPPQHRPRRPRRLGRLHVLWEVESWTPEPPRDPALIRHIRGDLWAVLATWDLTELERAVLAQRSTPR